MLRNKSIVIIGGTSGLGLSAAQALLREGACVVATGLDAEGVRVAASLLGESACVLQSDARETGSAEQAIEVCLNMFGRFDELYHVAGGSGRKFGDGPLHEITDDGWEQTLSLNLGSVFKSNRAAVRTWLALSQGGSLLNLGSVLGAHPSPEHFSTHAYAAAKSALFGFSRSLAAAYGPMNIRVNVLCPGLVDTPMARRAATNPAIQAFIAQKQPLDGGRMGLPSDLDTAVVYFLSDGSRFTTGQVLSVDGGWGVSESGPSGGAT